MATSPYRLHPRIEQFFEMFVNRPFEEIEPSNAWVQHVMGRSWSHRSTILDRGRADFAASVSPLTPDEMSLLYCHHYMQMHTASGYHVFQLAVKRHRLAFPSNLVFVDLGCGPLTSGISLAWHHMAEHPNEDHGPLLHYVGIDRAPAMLARARIAAGTCGLFHRDSTFDFALPQQSYEVVPRLLNLRRSTGGRELVVVLNCSYFFASRLLDLERLVAFVKRLLNDHLAHDKACMMFQNADKDELNLRWEQFKREVKELHSLGCTRETIQYHNTIDRTWSSPSRVRMRYELLLNRKWKASAEVNRSKGTTWIP